MKTPQQLSQEIIDIIKATGNYFVGNTSGMSNDGTVNVYHPKGYSISAIAANPISSGEVIVFKVNDTWYAFGEQRTIVKQDVLIQRKSSSSDEVIYPVITLIQSDWDTDYNPNPKPSGHKDVEYWLTGGGKYSLKRIVTNPLTLGFNNSEARLSFDGSEAFLQNAGNGKYLAATRSYELPPINYGGVPNRTYQRNIFTIQKEDKSVVKIIPNFYGNFTYLGNGIYQSFIEDGIGDIFEQIPSVLRNSSNLNNASINIGQKTANILPKNKNYCVYNGQIFELSGTINVDLTDAFLYYAEGSITIKDRTFAWRNKTIQHQVWLPTGNSTFNYSSTKTKVRNNLPGDENTSQYAYMYDYTFNETMSGEVLLMSWKNKYITSTFEIVKESKDWRRDEYIPGIGFPNTIQTLTEEIKSKNEILTLKTYGDAEGEKNLVLNSNGKWLILPKRPKQLNSDTNLYITKETTAFRVSVDTGQLGLLPEGFNPDDYKPDYDLTPYMNENIITSFTINNNAYIVRGKITAINFEVYFRNNSYSHYGRYWFTIGITQFSLVPKVVSNLNANDFEEYREYLLPFPWVIILDNGCFWNYYLSYRNSAVDMESNITSYPIFRYGRTYSTLVAFKEFRDSFTNLVLCDQAIKYIPTNPITVPFSYVTFPYRTPFSVPKLHSFYNPPSNLLISDNLVGNSIYRVNDDILLQAYIDRAANEWLGITKMPVSEWKISNNGDIKYNKTFLVDYRLKRPYYNRETDESLSFNVIPVTHSYHP